MMPPTLHGQPALLVLSALQKHIRRSDADGAMSCAAELVNTNKAFCTMVCNRLEIICHEDLDTAARPDVFPFVHASLAFAKEHYDKDKIGKALMPIGNCIRLMCLAPKSRIGDHFCIVHNLRCRVRGQLAIIPDCANDMHTQPGKKLGRGIEHFRKEGAKLINIADDGSGYTEPVSEDRYADEAYALLAERQGALFADQED